MALFFGTVFGLLIAALCLAFAFYIAPNTLQSLKREVGPHGAYDYRSIGRYGSTYIEGMPVICTASWWGAAGYSNCPKELHGQNVTSEQVTLSTLFGSIHLTTKIKSKIGTTLYEVDDQTIVDRWWLYSKDDAWGTGLMFGAFAYVATALRNGRRK